MNLDSVQQRSQEQFARQSERYGKSHILQNVDNVVAGLQYVQLPARAKVLDVATGAGHTGLYLAESGHDVTLADIAEPMLLLARKTAEERGLRISTANHAAEELPYASNTFDLVTCRVAPHHFSSPDKFVRETFRVLKPGGSFLLIDGTVADEFPIATEWMHQVEKLRDPSHHRFLSPDTWAALVRTVGLQIVHTSTDRYKQPDLEWYFETAATPAANRAAVLDLVENAPSEARELFGISREQGKTIWWWQILTLVAVKSDFMNASLCSGLAGASL